MNDALRTVSTGFKLVLIGVVLMIIAVAIAIFGLCLLFAMAQGGGGPPGGPMAFLEGAMIFALIVVALYLIGILIVLVGRFVCMAVPPETGSAKSLLVFSVVAELVGISASILNVADAFANFLSLELKLVVTIGGSLASLAGTITFLMFTHRLATFIRRPDLASRALSVIWLGVGFVVCYVGALIFVEAAKGGGPRAGGPAAAGGCIGLVLVLVALLLLLIATIIYVIVLSGMSSALPRYASRGDYDDYGDYDDRDDGYDDDYDDRDDRDDDRDDRPRGRPWDRGAR